MGSKTHKRCCNLLLVFLFISVPACIYRKIPAVFHTVHKHTHTYKQKYIYIIYVFGKTIDCSHMKSCFTYLGCFWDGIPVDFAVKVGRYSLNAANDNGGKTREKEKEFNDKIAS